VLVSSPDLARQFGEIFERQVSGERAWEVSLADGRLHWSDGSAVYDSEPMSTTWQRFQAWLTRTLPVESQL
jgi:cardiolipin synthase C